MRLTALSDRYQRKTLFIADVSINWAINRKLADQSTWKSQEFVAEMRILTEMKIENRRTKYFPWQIKSTSRFFSMKIKMMDQWMQIEGTKLIFIKNFSVLDFFKFDSRMPQTALILVSTFKLFRGSMPPDPHRNFLFFFFFCNSRLC